jgi:hypothetical protein
MTEAAPDIPPWSPLADPARRQGDDGAVLSPADTPTGRPPTATPPAPADGSRPAGAGTEDTGGQVIDQLDRSDRRDDPGRSDRRGLRWLLAGLAAGAVVALVAVATLGGSDGTPATTVPAVRAPQPPTTPEDPAPLRSRVALGNGWTASVRGADLSSTRTLAPYNDDAELADDERYVLVDLELTYLDGPVERESPFYGVDLGVVGRDGDVVTTAEARCEVPDPPIDLDAELDRGATVRGRLCFAVPADQVPTLVLVAEPSMTPGAAPSYLALRPPG